MIARKLTVSIQKREAVPVRAIPHIAIDEHRFSPDELAKTLAGKATTARIRLPKAYHVINESVEPVDPREWNDVIRALDGLEAELRRKFGDGADGEAEWLRQSTQQLPANAFFWLDEFQTAWDEYVQQWETSNKRLLRAVRGAELDSSEQQTMRAVGALQDAPQLNFSPMRSAEVASTVLEGFHLKGGNDDATCGMSELVRNGELIKWDYWASRSDITPSQAARLCHYIDPIKWEDHRKFAQGDVPDYLRERIERLRQWLTERGERWSLKNLVGAVGAEMAPFGMQQAARNAPIASDAHTELTTRLGENTAQSIPVSRTKAQEQAIVEQLNTMGIDPTGLPKNRPGKSGIKKQVWDALKSQAKTFSSKSVFDTAWKRMRQNGDLKDN